MRYPFIYGILLIILFLLIQYPQVDADVEDEYLENVIIEDVVTMERGAEVNLTVDAHEKVHVIWSINELVGTELGILYEASRGLFHWELRTLNELDKTYEWGSGDYVFEWRIPQDASQEYDGTHLSYRIVTKRMKDSDGDGSPDKYDDFPQDPAASYDRDGDGYPEDWNKGCSGNDTTTGLHLDRFPYEEEASLDSDLDGYPDCWNPGFEDGDSRSLKRDKFTSDPSAAIDSDDDGSPNFWLEGKGQNDSTENLHLDAFPDDPAASVDSDGDGYPDEWNPGMGPDSSVDGLILDAYPFDPERWEKEEDEGGSFPTIVVILIILIITISIIIIAALVTIFIVVKRKKKAVIGEGSPAGGPQPEMRTYESDHQTPQEDHTDYGTMEDQYRSLYGNQ